MTTESESFHDASPRRAMRQRPMVPAVIVLLATAVIALLWVVPSNEFARGYQVFYTAFAVLLALGLLGIWLCFLSDLSWTIRGSSLIAAVAIIAVFAGSVRRVDLTGDLVPIIEFRWEKAPQQALSEHRAHHVTDPPNRATLSIDVGDMDMPEYRG